MQSGSAVLSLVARPLTVPILRAHRTASLRLPDLQDLIEGASQTTLRGQITNLRGVGALERQVRPGMPYTVENELTDAGRAILAVADTVEAWLAHAPQSGISLGGNKAKEVIQALVGGWSTKMLHALAARPLSLTELSGLIGDHSYPALERRLSAMRTARLVEPLPDEAGGAKPYGVTDWARRAVVPLVAAGRCESNLPPLGTEPLTRLDIEAAILLAMPLVAVEANRSGSCLLAIERPGNARPVDGDPAGVFVEVRDGTIVSSVPHAECKPETLAQADIPVWAEAILHGNLAGFEVGGEQPQLVAELTIGIHAALSHT